MANLTGDHVMIDPEKYIKDYLAAYKANTSIVDYAITIGKIRDWKEMSDLVFNAIRAGIATIDRFGPRADVYQPRDLTFAAVSQIEFAIVVNDVDTDTDVWSVILTRYVDGRSRPPYALRIRLYNGVVDCALDYDGINRLQQLFDHLAWRFDHELTDEEKVILMMSKLGEIRKFLSSEEVE